MKDRLSFISALPARPTLRAGSALAMASLLAAACSSDKELFPELDPEAFVSSKSSQPWVPEAGQGYETAHITPVGRGRHDAVTFEGRQSLMQLVALALELNPQTRSSWEAAQAAAASYGSVRGVWYPTFGLSLGLDYSSMLFPVGNFEVADINWLTLVPSAEVNYILLDFGRRSSEDAQARQALWAANLEFNRQIQQTIFDVQQAYFQLDNAIGLYEAALRELELALTVVAAVEDRMSVGLATAPELLFARQQLAQAEFDVQEQIAGIDDGRSALLVAIGLPATIPIEIEPLYDLPLPNALTLEVDDAIAMALQSRPDLAAAVADLRAAEAGVQAAEADFYPTVSFAANVGWEEFWSNTTVDRGTRDSVTYGAPVWNIGLTGNWVLFEGFSLRNNLREARALRRKAQADLEVLRIQTIGEVWDSYNDFLAAQRQYEFGVALVESSQESYEAMLATYEVGLATITELVAAEKDLAAALSTLVETRSFLLTSAARVGFAVGSGYGQASAAPSQTSQPLPQVVVR